MLDTKARILDVAERLFGHLGFDGTSLRAITAEAGVNLAAVNYHFQSKEALMEAVVARRIGPINSKRMEMLDLAEKEGRLTVEAILEAFLLPVLEAGEEFDRFRPLLGRMYSAPDEFIQRVFRKHLADIAQRFQAAMEKALPGLPAADRIWRLHFTVGTMAHVMSWFHIIPVMSGGLCDASDTSALKQRMVAFLAAGMRAPATATAEKVRY